MSLANPEDAASLLEQFVHDVANTPAEITHLLEEVHAKDLLIANLQSDISKRDAQLQKWVRLNGGHIAHPKEEAFSKTIHDCYDKCEILQAAKCGLSEKALVVLERQIKRLDIGLRGLSAREEFPADWVGPSLLSGSGTGVSTPAAAATSTGAPLQALSLNTLGLSSGGGGAPNVANAAQMRLAASGGASAGRSGGMTPISAPRNSSQRESSTEASASKRRRLNPTLGALLPSAGSNLRQSSLGPGTPKAGTPNPTTAVAAAAALAAASGTSRAGSAQPRPSGPAATGAVGTSGTASGQRRSGAPVASSRKVAPPSIGRKRDRDRERRNNAAKKGDRRRQLAGRDRATPSTNASVSDLDPDSPGAGGGGGTHSRAASATPSSLARAQADGAGEAAGIGASTTTTAAGSGSGTSAGKHPAHRSSARRHEQLPDDEDEDEDGDDEEEIDNQLYCFCHQVSHGNMIGCDNANCDLQWFHWGCVGLKQEPEGEWLCPTCRKLPKGDITIVSRDQ